MDLSQKLTQFVTKKLGSVIDRDLSDRVQDENIFFDVNAYADELFDKHFSPSEIENVENEIMGNRCRSNEYESDNSTDAENNSHESFEFDGNEFLTLSMEEIIRNLQSTVPSVRTKCLRELEICADDLINQTSWNVVKKILQNFLEGETDRETHLLTLKIFQKFLFCSNKPQVVSEAFTILAEIISVRIEVANLLRRRNSYEEIYDLRENKWLLNKKIPSVATNGSVMDSEILIKSMILLIKCQKQMPGKWIRFNDKKLREIVFAFIHLLSSTTNTEYEKVSGLELLSVLNPTGNWCKHWCHTATGRSLLCSALRKYRTFFTHIIEIILLNLRRRKSNQLLPVIDNYRLRDVSPQNHNQTRIFPDGKQGKENWLDGDRSQTARSAPISIKSKSETKLKSTYVVMDIPRNVTAEAVFCHSLSFVTVLIQFRSGRALFPVQTTCRKRLLTVQDLVTSLTDYLRAFERDDENIIGGVKLKSAYKEHMIEVMQMLSDVQTSIYSSRRSASQTSSRRPRMVSG
ncbi:hypothetical protein RUM43_006473 [Polyplax serrata]|uniref:BROMI middle region domain-containing protein n=1 Tax=Polyplax serrata TaxID=468196 RepID=A0AAN8NXV6_POLSC